MIEHIHSYYAATANASYARPRLEGEQEADICVIGAGYAGLSAALHLARRGYKVVVLEAAKVGWGASGRNGGQIVNGYSRDLKTIERRYGAEAAKALGAMALEGARIIRDWIETYGIACDYRPANVFAAFTAKQMRELALFCSDWSRRGHDGLEMLDKAGLQKHVKTDAYLGGAIDRHGGHVHPLNLALGEAAAAEGLGVRIFEQSSVLRVETVKGQTVATVAGGRVCAKVAVACGNAYLNGAVPFLRDKIMPVSTQIVTTEVLGADRLQELFPSGAAIEDVNYVLDYYRPTADGRLLFGGGIVYGGAEPANIEARLRPRIAKLFPSLAQVRCDYAWSGLFALTLTRIPHFGRIGSNLYFAHGCSGHGVTSMHLAGRLIADAIDGDVTCFDAFAHLPYHPFPGGRLFRVPLTALGAWWYRLRDQLGV